MSDVSAVKALVFDVFGTVVDWRTSLINDFTKWSETSGVKADWTALVDGWRAVYRDVAAAQPFLEPAARVFGQQARQGLIQAQSGAIGGNVQTKGPV